MRVTLREGDSIIVNDASDWRMADPFVSSFGFQLVARTTTGTAASIEMNTNRPWQNFLNPSDINNDGDVTARDALTIINELDRRAFSSRDTEVLVTPATAEAFSGSYYDQNGDGRASAVDALRVINRILAPDSDTEPSQEPQPADCAESPALGSLSPSNDMSREHRWSREDDDLS